MILIFFRLLAVFAMISALSAIASERTTSNRPFDIELWGRTYDYSCGYFSRRAADFAVTLHSDQELLPFGTVVNLIYGFSGQIMLGGPHTQNFDWADRTVVPATAIAEGSWEGRVLDKTLRSRSSGKFLDDIQFVFEVITPGNQPYYVNGGSSWGYFKSENANYMTECVENGVLPSWHKIPTQVVSRF